MTEQCIVIITGHYPPPFTANAIRAYYMARSLRKQGFDVIVIPLLSSWCGSRIGEFNEKIISPFVSVKSELKRPSVLQRLQDFIIKQKKRSKLLSVLRDHNPSTIIATLPPVEAIPIAFYIAKRLKIPLITDVQDLADDYRIMERPYLYPLIRYYFKKVYKAISEAELVLATTEFMAEELRKRIRNNNIIVVHNGVDIKRYTKCFEIRQSFKTQEPIAVFLGDLNWKYHKLESFIKALNLLHDEGIKVRLKVIGTGKLLPKLQKLTKKLRLENQVKFFGYLEFNKLIREMGTSSFAVAGRPAINNKWIKTSIRLTIYEYLACGLPILAYGPPNSYTQHFIEESKTGIYIQSDNEVNIAKGVLKLLQLAKKATDINYRCKQVALTYEWNTIMEKWAIFIKDVAN